MKAEDIVVSFNDEIEYGVGKVFVVFPRVFPTVTFELEVTDGLKKAVDAARVKAGIKLRRDSDGWYDAYIGINSFTPSRLDTCIEAVVVNEPDQPDNEGTYMIDLTEDEQKEIFAEIDRQCKEKLGKSCEELLEEARKEMEE